jgi:glycosyltransferase involved in cell wall biosynthesis
MQLRSLRLALVTRRYPPLIGGAERVFSYLAAALADEGAQVTVLTSRHSDLQVYDHGESFIAATPSPDSDGPASASLRVTRLRTSSLRVWGTLLYMNELAHWFRANPVDLAYVSMLKHDAYTVVRAAKVHHFPVILRPEGAGKTGDIAWQSWGHFGRHIGRHCRQADAFVAISTAIETELRDAWHRGTMRPSLLDQWNGGASTVPNVVTIPNGVPVPANSWQRRVNWTNTPSAVFVGRLAAEKGLNTLIDAWPLVRAKHPRARLTLVGEGPDRVSLEASARARGLTLGAEGAVNFPGRVTDPEPLLRDADLFILPSHEEGMSIALLEAMALGIPLVASSIPGNRRLVTDFQHGRLAAPDAASLAVVILEQWSHFDHACEMGCAARKRVQDEFSIQLMARRHLELFGELVNRSR